MSYFSEFTLPIQKEKVGVSGSKDTLWEWQTNIQVCILRILFTIPGIFLQIAQCTKKVYTFIWYFNVSQEDQESNIFFCMGRMQNTKSWPIFCCQNNEWYFWFAVGTSNLLCHLFLACQSKRFASRQQAWKGTKISLWMEYCMKKKKSSFSIPFWLSPKKAF